MGWGQRTPRDHRRLLRDRIGRPNPGRPLPPRPGHARTRAGRSIQVLDVEHRDLVATSDAWPAASAAIRSLRLRGVDDAEIHDWIYAGRGLTGAHDSAAVVAWRLRHHTTAVSIVPPPLAAGDPELRAYASELRQLLIERAAANDQAMQWDQVDVDEDLAAEVTTYRAVTGWGGPDPLGPIPDPVVHQRAPRCLHGQLHRSAGAPPTAIAWPRFWPVPAKHSPARQRCRLSSPPGPSRNRPAPSRPSRIRGSSSSYEFQSMTVPASRSRSFSGWPADVGRRIQRPPSTSKAKLARSGAAWRALAERSLATTKD